MIPCNSWLVDTRQFVTFWTGWIGVVFSYERAFSLFRWSFCIIICIIERHLYSQHTLPFYPPNAPSRAGPCARPGRPFFSLRIFSVLFLPCFLLVHSFGVDDWLHCACDMVAVIVEFTAQVRYYIVPSPNCLCVNMQVSLILLRLTDVPHKDISTSNSPSVRVMIVTACLARNHFYIPFHFKCPCGRKALSRVTSQKGTRPATSHRTSETSRPTHHYHPKTLPSPTGVLLSQPFLLPPHPCPNPTHNNPP
jgi:hypothetical protein